MNRRTVLANKVAEPFVAAVTMEAFVPEFCGIMARGSEAAYPTRQRQAAEQGAAVDWRRNSGELYSGYALLIDIDHSNSGMVQAFGVR